MNLPFSNNSFQAEQGLNYVQAGAIKVFDEADGSAEFYIPGVSERYEDLAADFLEDWLQNSD